MAKKPIKEVKITHKKVEIPPEELEIKVRQAIKILIKMSKL